VICFRIRICANFSELLTRYHQTGSKEMTMTIGVLGSISIHYVLFLLDLPRLNASGLLPTHICSILVKTPLDLSRCQALIIPGGESTTIALLARSSSLLEPLREFVHSGKPVWGTCAGAILLANGGVEGVKKGGQEVLGGMDVKVERNGWGSQLESFETDLHISGIRDEDILFRGIFIRAPVILSLKPLADESVTILSRIPVSDLPASHVYSRSEQQGSATELVREDDPRLIVALCQGRRMMTTFHPELTLDDRVVEYFVRECVLGGEKRGI